MGGSQGNGVGAAPIAPNLKSGTTQHLGMAMTNAEIAAAHEARIQEALRLVDLPVGLGLVEQRAKALGLRTERTTIEVGNWTAANITLRIHFSDLAEADALIDWHGNIDLAAKLGPADALGLVRVASTLDMLCAGAKFGRIM